jgi:D-serine deaminase-like pyridoxal phosphate-dependent protein
MANTFDTSRVGGGTYELAQDANGNYNLNSVGFTQVKKLNLPDLKTSDTSVADTTKKATEDTIKAQTTEVFKPANVYQSSSSGGEGEGSQSYDTMADSKFAKEAKEATVRSAGSSMPQASPGQLSKDKARAEANVEVDLEKSQPQTGLQKIQSGITTGLQKVKSAVTNTVTSIASSKAIGIAATVLGITNPVVAVLSMISKALPKDSPTDAFNRGYHPTNDTGRVSSNPSKDVFGGMNAVSGFGDIDKAAQSRVDNRNNVDKTGWSKEKTDRFDKTTKSFENK